MIYAKIPVVLCSIVTSEPSDSLNHHIARTVLENLDMIRDMNIKELAALTHVGVGSISRFCKEIGFENFADFKEALGDQQLRKEEVMQEDLSEHLSASIHRAIESVDMKQVEKLCMDIQNHTSIFTCGMLKAQNAAIDLQVDLLMHGKYIDTSIVYAHQVQTIAQSKKDDLIIIFSYTGSYFTSSFIRKFKQKMALPKIWMIAGNNESIPDFVDETIIFDSSLDLSSHPFTLEAIESLIAGTYTDRS